jgi:hypothetical protein
MSGHAEMNACRHHRVEQRAGEGIRAKVFWHPETLAIVQQLRKIVGHASHLLLPRNVQINTDLGEDGVTNLVVVRIKFA